jgi:S-DNA-T family DNA segregation ATPase FtsK/SpoIIIE
MRKEIAGILLFFLVVLTLVSLLSYSPTDPSINNARTIGKIHNHFGVIGAHLAGFMIGLFGLGAFWIPILLLMLCLQFFGKQPVETVFIVVSALGGILLVVTTGSLLAIQDNHYLLFGNQFSSGGIIGISLKTILLKYANPVGGTLILAVLCLIGFMMATGVSIISFFKTIFKQLTRLAVKVKTWLAIRAERRKKVRQHKSPVKPVKTARQNETEDIEIKPLPQSPIKPNPKLNQQLSPFIREDGHYRFPAVNFLDNPQTPCMTADNENLRMQSGLLEKKLDDFKVKGKVVTIFPGPVITTFEYEPAPGIKINKVVSLSDDLALALKAMGIRIVAPIPGKAVIGIEIPNAVRELVHIRDIIISGEFEKSPSKLTICLGKNVVGIPVVADLAKMPHLLIAGATGTGKSVGLNAMITSILYKASPKEVKFIMIDPKRIELSIYDDIPHLITPVVTDVKKATNALFWAIKEMERRYEMLAEKSVRNIKQYNQKLNKEKKHNDIKNASDKSGDNIDNDDTVSKTSDTSEPLPYIVIIIDELADLMMVTSRDVEIALTRLAQMARAAGIHLILATQRPSVDVLTGIIKANFPTRLTFQVSSRTDSRTIIDANGAEQLLGNGDMLFLPPGTACLQRIHGAFISEEEIVRVTDFLKSQKSPDYDQSVTAIPEEQTGSSEDQEYDDRYDDAVALVTQNGQASISMIQRHLRIGYNRAARIIEVMEKEGIVGPSDGAKPREVLVKGYTNMP